MVWSIFGGRRDNQNNPVAAAAATALAPAPFPEQLAEWIEELNWYERESSGILSASVYSRLRIISDLLVNINSFIKDYPIRPEDEYILKSTVTDYIPSALNIFNQLPSHEQVPGGEADVMLLDQCENIERSVRKLNTEMHERVKSNLASQTIFVENRFNNQP